MGITVKRRGNPPRFNPEAVEREIKRFAPGAIIERVGRGIDINGQPFAPYSRRYRNFLKRGGEDQKIDLRLSGGLMNSVKARDAVLRADSVEVTIAPDTGTSPVWTPKSGSRARATRAGAKGKDPVGAYRMQRTGKQSPPHNVVGYWLHYGTPTMRARPWLGLDPKQRAYLLQMIARVMWR